MEVSMIALSGDITTREKHSGIEKPFVLNRVCRVTHDYTVSE